MSKKLKAKVLEGYGKTNMKWNTKIENHMIRIETPDGTQYELSYEPLTGMKLSSKKDVLIITPRSSNVVVIKQNKMGDEMEGEQHG